MNRPPLPAVELPQDLARLLRDVEARWNDKAGLAELYTEDSVVFSTENPGWIHGRDEEELRTIANNVAPYLR